MEQKIGNNNLPINWSVCNLDDILLKISNGANVTQFDEIVGYPISRIETIWNQGIDLDRVKYILEDDFDFVEKYSLHYGDILFSHINSDAHLGKTGVFKNQVKTLIHGINILLIRPACQINSDFLNFQFNHLRTKGGFVDIAQRSVNQSSVNQRKLKSLQIIVPPQAEQHRIVSKIEELFSELDKGIESIKTARAQLKVYRQAILKDAFEGKLTAVWREQNKEKLETAATLQQLIQTERAARYQQQLTDWQANGQEGCKPKVPKLLPPLTSEELAELPLMPKGWTWARLGNVFADSPKNGIYKSADFYGEGTSIVRIDDFYDGLLSKTSGFKKVKLSENEINTFSANLGDLLINRVNSIEYLGKCCEIKGIEESLVFESNIMKIKLSDNLVNNFYTTTYLASSFGRKRLCANAKHAVNQASINQNDVSLTPIPMSVLSEQKVISELLDAKLSEIDKLNQTINTALIQSEVLRQSILKKAFSGALVAQDSNDEPASELLTRIKIEQLRNKIRVKS